MDLRRLRHFNVLAETLNFSRAAERLHIAQPALSVSIQKLETELGTRLFERTPSGVVLTASGEAVLIEARRMLYHGEQLQRAARDAATGTGGRLRVGFVGSAIHELVPMLVSAFRAQYPGVELVLQEATSTRILRMLGEEGLDIGIVRVPLLDKHSATLRTLVSEPFVAVLPAGHRLAAHDTLSLGQLAEEPFVMYSPAEAAGLHASAMAACQSAGFVPQVTQEATQITTVVALVAIGLGVALVPRVMSGHLAPKVVYREIDGLPDAGMTAVALAWHAGSESPAAARFLEVAQGLLPGG